MEDEQRDKFSGRLQEQPDQANIKYYRIPKLKNRLNYLWDPLIALNRSQAIMLGEAEILKPSEVKDILAVLEELEENIDITDLDQFEDFEGPYFYIENYLIQHLGDEIGGKLHTGRSRNDLYAAAFRIAARDRILEIMTAVIDLRKSLLQRAKDSTDIVFPAFTHSQPAQPITFAHYLLAFDNLVSRDFGRLKDSFKVTNKSPLGAAAIGGTGFPLDRERLAELSGFSDIVYNSFDAISSVDYIPEITHSLALLMTNISRISQDFLTWNMFEVKFIELSENMSSVSSIMPQKKNPGVLEKTRAQATDFISEANSSLVALKAVPYGDVGENTYGAMSFLKNTHSADQAIRLFTAIIEDIELNEDEMHKDAVKSFCTMTELADILVRKGGISFRQAHEVAGQLTHIMYSDGRTAEDITLDDLNQVLEENINDINLITKTELKGALDPIKNVNRHDIVGGTAPKRNQEDISKQEDLLSEQLNWLDETKSSLQDAREKRVTTNPSS